MRLREVLYEYDCSDVERAHAVDRERIIHGDVARERRERYGRSAAVDRPERSDELLSNARYGRITACIRSDPFSTPFRHKSRRSVTPGVRDRSMLRRRAARFEPT
jgi:hypothetical protein